MQPLFRDSAQLNCPLIPFAAAAAAARRATDTVPRPLSRFFYSPRVVLPSSPIIYTRGSAFRPQILMETFKQYGTNTGKIIPRHICETAYFSSHETTINSNKLFNYTILFLSFFFSNISSKSVFSRAVRSISQLVLFPSFNREINIDTEMIPKRSRSEGLKSSIRKDDKRNENNRGNTRVGERLTPAFISVADASEDRFRGHERTFRTNE